MRDIIEGGQTDAIRTTLGALALERMSGRLRGGTEHRASHFVPRDDISPESSPGQRQRARPHIPRLS